MKAAEFKKLGDYVKIKTGKLDANASSDDGEYPFFTCSIEPLKISSFSYDCECCLVAGNGDLNVKYYNGKFDAYQRTYIIESLDKEKLDVMYLYFFLCSYIEVLRKQSIGGVIKYIKLGNLTDALIPIPSLEKQKEICRNLIQAQKVLNENQALLSKYDILIKSRFIEMFGDPVQNSKGYKYKKLEELGKWESGGTPSRKNNDYFKGSIPWYSAGELNSLYLYDSNEKITETAIEESSAKLFRKGSLFVGMYDTAAFKMGIATTDCSSNQACANIFPNRDVNVIWLYYELMEMKEFFLQNRRGVRQKNLNLGMIKGFEIPYAPSNLQNDFAAFVQQIDKSKFVVQKSLEKAETLYKSLMQEYFG